MVKKSPTQAERLDAIEQQLRRLQALVEDAALPPTPLFWDRYFVPRRGAPGAGHQYWLDLCRAMKDKALEVRETPVAGWQHLVQRQHPWRKQLYIKGRNLTARQLVGGIKANQLDVDKAAASYDLPMEAIQEALVYVDNNQELLETEAEIERLMLKRGGTARGPQPVP